VLEKASGVMLQMACHHCSILVEMGTSRLILLARQRDYKVSIKRSFFPYDLQNHFKLIFDFNPDFFEYKLVNLERRVLEKI